MHGQAVDRADAMGDSKVRGVVPMLAAGISRSPIKRSR
jgi:hypothetical protein